jgi:nitroreductase
MMDILEVIKTRRSIRSFNSKRKVDKKDILRLLEAAVWAPSGGNVQPWKFYVVTNPEKKDGLFEASYRQEYILEAPVSIVICIDQARAKAKYGDRGLNLYAIQDTAAAIQNILLSATTAGLGTCWIGAFDEKKAQSCLNLESNLRPVAIIPVGYPNESPHPPHRDEIDSVSHWIE